MPIDAAGPLNDVTKPTLISACAATASKVNGSARTSRAIVFIDVLPEHHRQSGIGHRPATCARALLPAVPDAAPRTEQNYFKLKVSAPSTARDAGLSRYLMNYAAAALRPR